MDNVVLAIIRKENMEFLHSTVLEVTSKAKVKAADSVVIYSGQIVRFASDEKTNQLWIPYPNCLFWDKETFQINIEFVIICNRLLEKEIVLDFYKTAMVELAKSYNPEKLLISFTKDEYYHSVWHSICQRFSDDPQAGPENIFDQFLSSDTKMFVEITKKNFISAIPEVANLEDSILALGLIPDEIVYSASEDIDFEVKDFLDLRRYHEDFQKLMIEALPLNRTVA